MYLKKKSIMLCCILYNIYMYIYLYIYAQTKTYIEIFSRIGREFDNKLKCLHEQAFKLNIRLHICVIYFY